MLPRVDSELRDTTPVSRKPTLRVFIGNPVDWN